MFHNNLPHYRITYPIIDDQVINAVGQVGKIKLHIAAFGCRLALQISLTVVETNVEGGYGYNAFRLLIKHITGGINFDIEKDVSRVGINSNISIKICFVAS